jgi:hypothetical protein
MRAVARYGSGTASDAWGGHALPWLSVLLCCLTFLLHVSELV